MAVDGIRRHLGDDHTATLETRDILGKVLIDRGKLDEAQQVLGAVISDRQRLFGEATATTNYARGLLAETLWKRAVALDGGQRDAALKDAERYVLESLQILRSAPDRGSTYGMEKASEALYEIYRLQGRLADAVTLSRNEVAKARGAPQEGDYGRIANEWCDDLIYVLTETKQLEEALAASREQVEILRRTRVANHPSTLRALNALAWALFEAGRFAEAEAPAREAVSGYRAATMPDVVDQINTIDTLACVLCKLERPDEAEGLFREIFALFARGMPPRFFPGDAGLHALHFGECLVMLKRYPEAEARFLEALKAAEAAAAAAGTVKRARERLMQLYETLGLSDRASEYRDEAVAQP
jgi:tetratricopeptide (TPR) repeat protein